MPTEPKRRGASGRIPDSKVAEHDIYIRNNITLPPELKGY